FEDALEFGEKLLALNPNHYNAYNNLGYVYLGLDNIEKAFECWEKSLELNPEYGHAWHSLGEGYEEKEEFETAILLYKKALSTNPKEKIYIKSIRKLYKKLGKDYSLKAIREEAAKMKGKKLDFKNL
ncbi:MAG: tetratricopeptide repeat protein, partial [Asgard group archaeon]|nr:tetratricopeptide repeat protein [Asgard group archaeon]